jgi:zinc/manganese transport system substrate-binding protein
MQRRALLALGLASPAAPASSQVHPARPEVVAPALPEVVAPARPEVVAPARPEVVASFTILADFVRQIAGPRISLRTLLAPEADPHEFAPRPSDAVAVRDALLVVRNGLGLEPWLDRLLRAAPPRGRVVSASDAIEPLVVNNLPDPHAWLDPLNAQHYARRIGEALAAALPAQAPALLAATEVYQTRLARLQDRCAERFAAVPAGRRVFVVGHPGFGYFAARFGLEMLAPPRVAGARTVAALIRQVRDRRLRALYFTGPEDAALMRRVAAESGLPVLGRLFVETLSAADGLAPTYEALLRHNTTLLVTGMQA